MEHKALSQTSPTKAPTLLSLMQGYFPEPKKADPVITWKERRQEDGLRDGIRQVRFYQTDKAQGEVTR